MPKKRTFKVGEETFDIPEQEVDVFLADMPDAIELQSFVVAKDTFDIPLAEVDAFVTDNPDAVPTFGDSKKKATASASLGVQPKASASASLGISGGSSSLSQKGNTKTVQSNISLPSSSSFWKNAFTQAKQRKDAVTSLPIESKKKAIKEIATNQLGFTPTDEQIDIQLSKNPNKFDESIASFDSKRERDAEVATSTAEDIYASGNEFYQSNKADKNALATFDQSRKGKVFNFIRSVNNGERIDEEDVRYWESVSPTSYNQMLEITKQKHPELSVSHINTVADLNKIDNETYQQVEGNKQVKSDIATISNYFPTDKLGTGQVSELYKKLEESEQEELAKAKGDINTMGASFSLATPEFKNKYRTEEAEKENAIRSKYDEIRNKVANADTYAYAVKNPNKSVLELGEHYMQLARPSDYANYIQGGKQSPEFKANATKVGIALAQSSGSPMWIEKAKLEESDFDKKYPAELEDETRRRIAIEYAKRKGGANTFLNGNVIDIEEVDEIIDGIPAKFRNYYTNTLRDKTISETTNISPFDIVGGIKDMFGVQATPKLVVPPIGGVVDEFYGGLSQPVIGLGNTVMNVFESKENKANRALKKPDILNQKLVNRTEIQKEIETLSKKENPTVEEINQLNDLKEQVEIQTPIQETLGAMSNLTGQVGGQVLLTATGGGLIKGGTGLVNIGTKSIPLGNRVQQIANWTSDIKNLNNVAGSTVAYLSSYDDANLEAQRIMPNGSFIEKQLYAQGVAVLNAATERIFKDEKILDAFKKEVSPAIATLVQKFSSGKITEEALSGEIKNIISKTLPKYAGNIIVENQKEAAEELATSMGTTMLKGFGYLTGAVDKSDFNIQDELDGWKQTWYETTVSGVPVGVMAGIGSTRRNAVNQKTLYNLARDKKEREQFVEVIKAQQEQGKMSLGEATDKIQAANTLGQIYQQTLPLINKVKPLSNREAVSLTSLLFSERKLKKDILNPELADIKSLNEKQLRDVQSQKDKILNGEAIVDSDLQVLTPEEWKAKNRQEEVALTNEINNQQPVLVVTNADGKFEVNNPNGNTEIFDTQELADARVKEITDNTITQNNATQNTQTPSAESTTVDGQNELPQTETAVTENVTVPEIKPNEPITGTFNNEPVTITKTEAGYNYETPDFDFEVTEEEHQQNIADKSLNLPAGVSSTDATEELTITGTPTAETATNVETESLTPKTEQDAIQIEKPTPALSSEERPELELQPMGEGNQQSEITPTESKTTVEEKETVTPTTDAGTPTPSGTNTPIQPTPSTEGETKKGNTDKVQPSTDGTRQDRTVKRVAVSGLENEPKTNNNEKQQTDNSTNDRGTRSTPETAQGIAKREEELAREEKRIDEAERKLGFENKTIPVSDIEVNPKVFQFKAQDEESGVNKREKLTGKYDKELGGSIDVWVDEENELGNGAGKIYVVDGHHRLDLAKRDGTENIEVRYINAPTAKDARVIGAKRNISQGRGTSIDAAKIYRDATKEQLENFSPKSNVGKEGQALAKLNDQTFEAVATGTIPVKVGIALSQVDKSRQTEVAPFVKKFANNPIANQDKLNRYARKVEEAIVSGNADVKTIQTLFGEEKQVDIQNAAVVESEIINAIKNDARLFSAVKNNKEVLENANNQIDVETATEESDKAKQAAGLFDTFRTTKAVNDIYTKAVSDYKKAKTPKQKSDIISKAATETKDAIQKELSKQIPNLSSEKSTTKPKKSITKEAFTALTTMLKKAFPNVEFIDEARAKEILNSKNETNKKSEISDKVGVSQIGRGDNEELSLSSYKSNENIQLLQTNDGQIFGFQSGNEIYLDNSMMNADTPVHEVIGHYGMNIIDAQSRGGDARATAIMTKGLDLLKEPEGKAVLEEVQANPAYANLPLRKQKLEAVATIIGREGAGIFEEGTKEGKIIKTDEGQYWLVDKDGEFIDGDKRKWVVEDMAKRWGYSTSKPSKTFTGKVKAFINSFYEYLKSKIPTLKGKSIADIQKMDNKEFVRAIIGDAFRGEIVDEAVEQKVGIAPNGKKSKLTDEQWKLVRTPEFINWFGDWVNEPEKASKVVDENGEPLVVYHGTKDFGFEEFSKDKLGTNTKAGSATQGFFFSKTKNTALNKSYVDLKNKIDEMNNPFYWAESASVEAAKKLQELGISDDKIKRIFGSNIINYRGEVNEDYSPVENNDYENSDSIEDTHSFLETIYNDIFNEMDEPAESILHKDPKFKDIDERYITTATDEEKTLHAKEAVKISEALMDEHFSDIKNAIEILGSHETELIPNEDLGSGVYSLFLNARKPLVYDQNGESYRERTYYEIIREAKTKDYDGVVIKNTYDGGGLDDIYVAFEPNQIKNADGTNTQFSPDTNNIQFSADGNAILNEKNRNTLDAWADKIVSGEPLQGYIDKINKIPQSQRQRFIDYLNEAVAQRTPKQEPPKTPPPKSEPTEPKFSNEKKSILNRIYNSKNIPQYVKDLFEQYGLDYKPQSHEVARRMATNLVNEFGVDNAMRMAETGKFGGDVNSMIFAIAIDRTYEAEQLAKTPEEKLELAMQWADYSKRYDEIAREKGRFISAIQDFYKKSPLGMIIKAEQARNESFKDWFKNKKSNFREVYEAIKDEPEFKDIVKEQVESELKDERKASRETRRKKIEDIFDQAKIKNTGLGSFIIPPQIWNGAIEVMKQATLAGESLVNVIEQGIKHIRDNHKGGFDENALRKQWQSQFQGIDAKGKTPPTAKEVQQKILDRFRKKLTGLSDSQKEDVIRKSFKKLVENGALDYDDFKQIVADTLGLGKLSPEEIKRMTEYVKDINSVQDAAENVLKERTKKSIDDFEKATKKAEKASTELGNILNTRVDVVRRIQGIIQLNTLGIVSLVRNPVYNLFYQLGVRLPRAVAQTGIDGAIYGISALANKVAGTKIIKPDVNIFLAQKGYFKKLSQGGGQAIKQLFTGLTSMDYFQKEVGTSQIKPAKSWKDLYSWYKGEKFLSSSQIADKVIQGTVGIPAEAVARMLNIGDKPFRYAAEGAIAETIATQEFGLKGIDREIFVRFPKEEALRLYQKQGLGEEEATRKAEAIEKRIIDEGEKAVFQQKNLITEGLTALGNGMKHFSEDNPTVKVAYTGARILGTLNAPFLKTPLNLFWDLFNLAVPEVAFAQSALYGFMAAKEYHNGDDIKSRDYFLQSKKWLAHGAVGMMLLKATAFLVGIGAVSGGGDDDEKEGERRGRKNYEKEKSINVTKLIRVMNGGSAETEDNDLQVDLAWYGNLGMLMNMQANRLEAGEVEMEYMQDLLSRMHGASVDGLENSIFSGTIAAIDAFKKGGSFTNAWFRNQINVAANFFQPATLAQFSRASLPYNYRVKGDNIVEELRNNFQARSMLFRAYSGYPPSDINIWGEEAMRNNTGAKGIAFNMLGFDEANREAFAYPVFQDYKETGNPDFFPPVVLGFEVDGKPAKLTSEQTRQFRIYVGQARKELVAPFVNGYGTFEESDYEELNGKTYSEMNQSEKVKALNILYRQGRELGRQKFVEINPQFQSEKEKAEADY